MPPSVCEPSKDIVGGLINLPPGLRIIIAVTFPYPINASAVAPFPFSIITFGAKIYPLPGFLILI